MTTRTSPDGRSHRIDQTLLARLNALPFYTQSDPKSLGREWVEAEVYPLIDSFGLPAETVLATFVEHVAMQIASHVRSGQVLVTGGAAPGTRSCWNGCRHRRRRSGMSCRIP